MDNSLTSQFKLISIIYGALIIGQIIFFAVALFLVENLKIKPDQSLDEIFRLLIPLLGIVAMFFAHRFYNNKISAISENDELSIKLIKFRSYKIIQWAEIEAASLISIIAFILTGNYLYVIVFLFMIGFFILNRPSKEIFVNDFKISGAYKDKF